MKPLRIIFMGSPEFAIPSLEAIYNSDHEIVAVVSNPDKRRRRRSRPEPTPVKRRAAELSLETIDADRAEDPTFARKITALKPDLLVVVAFRILPKSILDIPAIGSVNLHASLLPKYRGAAPIHWAVINGEEETGCTVFFLDEKVDTGEIIGRSTTPIGPFETTGEVYDRLKKSGAELLKSCVDDIATGKRDGEPQEHSEATPAPKLFDDNTRIDFSKTVQEVHNLIRGLNPFPVAWTTYDGKKMNVYASEPLTQEQEPGFSPGTMKEIDGELTVACADGYIALKEVQLPGTKRLSGKEFINGYGAEDRLI